MGLPKLSVVLATAGSYLTLEKTIGHLCAQTICGDIELVLVCPPTTGEEVAVEDLTKLGSYQIVQIDKFRSIGASNAVGVRAAHAPVIALAEDHCFPDDDWAERLLESHSDGWAAVGPGVRNANPRTMMSWADLFIGYGPWLLPSPSGEAPFLPGHNSSYNKSMLLEYGDRLEEMMEAETVLHWDLKEKGRGLFMDARAKVAHTNFSLWSSWIPAQFYNGRQFAYSRSRGKGFVWRLAYVVGSPVIPFVRAARMWPQLKSRELRMTYLQVLPMLLVGLGFDALGQMAGYAFGRGNAETKLARYEVDRYLHITPSDRADLFGAL